MTRSDEVLIETYVKPDQVLMEFYSMRWGSRVEYQEPIMDAIHDILTSIQSNPSHLFYLAGAARKATDAQSR